MADLITVINQVCDPDTARVAVDAISRELLKAGDSQRRKNLNEMRKLLQHTIEDRLFPAMDHDERLDDLAAGWRELCEMFKPHLPAEVWDKIGTRVEECFSKARLREGLKY